VAGEEEEGGQPLDLKDWWVNFGAYVYTDNNWKVPKAVRDWVEREDAVRGDAEGGGDDDDDEGEVRGEGRDYNYSSPILRDILRAWCHKWGRGGEHVAWLEIKDWRGKVLSDLGRDVPLSTAYNYLEKGLYKKGRSYQTRPDLAELLSAVRVEEGKLKEVLVEVEP
jgi:hypothetical protein